MEKMDHPFVQLFSDYWSKPTLEGVSDLVHDDAIFIQPLTKPLGTSEYHKYVKSILETAPDINGEVISYAESENTDDLFIHWVMRFSVGKGRKEIDVVDLIHLSEGKVAKRTAHMDLVPVLRSIIVCPSVWYRWLRFIMVTNRLKAYQK